MSKRLAVTFVALSTWGCVGGKPEQLRARAAYDLSCSDDELELSKLKKGYRVTGCSQEAFYAKDCERRTMAISCTWILVQKDGKEVNRPRETTAVYVH